jgi:hypothetical protein
MFAGFLAVKTKPAQACRPSCFPADCPDYCHTDTVFVGDDGCEKECPPNAPEEESCPEECHYDTVYVSDGQCGQKECLSNSPEAGTCPTECGYPGGTVPDGICGTLDCSATDPCENGPTSTPTPTPISPRGGPGPAGPPVCGAATPAAPHLISATTIGGNKVGLKWSKVNGASHYTIYYGPSSGNYLYSVPNTGDTDNFIIEGMSGGCFAVRAVNDCAPSEASNEVCTGAVGGVAQVLGLSDTSNDLAQSLFFWAGMAMIVFGTRLIGREASGKISA